MSQGKGDKLVVPADQPLVPSEFALIRKVAEILLKSLGIADGVSLFGIRSLPVVHESQLLADIYVEEPKQAGGVQDVEGDGVVPARLVEKHGLFEGPKAVNHS